MNKTTINIMIVDDHPMIIQGLRSLIETEPDMHVCCEAEGVSSALKVFSQLDCDLIIIDLSLKDGSGFELVRRMHTQNNNTHIIVLSHFDEELYAERCLAAGAEGYVSKQRASKDIIHAIRKVMSGEKYISEQLKAILFERGTTIDDAVGTNSLSTRELEVFELMGKGLKTKDIADQLCLSVKTIETHRDHIRLKLGLNNGHDVTIAAVHWFKDNS